MQNPPTGHRFSLANILFITLVLCYALLGQILVQYIPYGFPFGGPDELMHISMADYIAQHLSWPQWDSPQIVRNPYGISYSTGGSITYWLHGLAYKATGHYRMGAYLLLLVYLGISILLYRKNKLAGFLLLAVLLPQTLYVFSYVNTDSGTIVTALLFGIVAGRYLSGKDSSKDFIVLFFFAGLNVTARQHLWAMAFVALVWIILYKRHTIRTYDKKVWFYAILTALIPASWWFITSYLANDGDILGVFTNAKAMIKFGSSNLPPLTVPWHDFSLYAFVHRTFKSLYAYWGWMSITLPAWVYFFATTLITAILVLLYRIIDRKILLFFLSLFTFNLLLVILYSLFYDYQSQGRYLFPSVYIIVGMLSGIVLYRHIVAKKLLSLLVLLSLLNGYAGLYLTFTSYIDAFIPKSTHESSIVPPQYYQKSFYHIDSILTGRRKISIRGWAFNTTNYQIFQNATLILEHGKDIYRLPLREEVRPDVAAAFHCIRLAHAGFSIGPIDIHTLPPTSYHVRLSTMIEGKERWIDLNKTVKVETSALEKYLKQKHYLNRFGTHEPIIQEKE